MAVGVEGEGGKIAATAAVVVVAVVVVVLVALAVEVVSYSRIEGRGAAEVVAEVS